MSETKEDKNKKINKMTAAELDAAMKKTIENQGDLNSRYGRELSKQKAFLAASK